jgi:hypothetical protein
MGDFVSLFGMIWLSSAKFLVVLIYIHKRIKVFENASCRLSCEQTPLYAHDMSWWLCYA